MEFSENEEALIDKATVKLKQNQFVRIFVLVAFAIGMCTVLFGLLEHKYFINVAYLALFVMIAHMASGPRYNDLVNLLNSKRTQSKIN